MATRVVEESRTDEARQLDLVGLGLGTAGLFSITYALIEANQRGWDDALILGALCVGVVLIAALAVVGVRHTAPDDAAATSSGSRRSPPAISSLSPCRMGMFGTFFFFSLYMQLIRGYSALGAGVRFLPLTGMIFFVAPQAGRFAQRHGSRWPMTIGPLMAGTGLLLLSRSGVDTPFGLDGTRPDR